MTAKHFVSKTCEGENCGICVRFGTLKPATHKVGEEIPFDHPSNHPDPMTNALELAAISSLAGHRRPRGMSGGHNYTVYVCCFHFEFLFGIAICDPNGAQP